MNPIPLQPPTPKPAQRFAAIVEMLRRFIAARGLKGVISIPLQILLWRRLGRLIRRVQNLAARVEAGTLPKPRARAPRPRRAQATTALRPPRRFAWLIRPVPEASAARSQLEYLLAQPDMQALIAAAPTMGRLLRPLCHMLGLRPPPAIALPRRPPARKPRPAPAPVPRPPTQPTRSAPAHSVRTQAVRTQAVRTQAVRTQARAPRAPPCPA